MSASSRCKSFIGGGQTGICGMDQQIHTAHLPQSAAGSFALCARCGTCDEDFYRQNSQDGPYESVFRLSRFISYRKTFKIQNLSRNYSVFLLEIVEVHADEILGTRPHRFVCL